MTFRFDIDNLPSTRVTLKLHGRLDAATFGEFDGGAQPVLAAMPKGGTVVLDLADLDYISSAGLRSIAKIRKHMKAIGGQTLVVNPQPQVRKVFDIVKAVPVNEVFASTGELDAYLDKIQRKIVEGNDEDDAD